MITQTYRFQKITTAIDKRGKCPVCGKSVTRSRTFYQTQNPYNLNPDGTQKTALTIYEELSQQAAAWEPDFTHQKCEASWKQ